LQSGQATLLAVGIKPDFGQVEKAPGGRIRLDFRFQRVLGFGQENTDPDIRIDLAGNFFTIIGRADCTAIPSGFL
jgi:hypothetical protein